MKTFNKLIAELQADYGMADWAWYLVIIVAPAMFLTAVYFLPQK